MSEPFEPKVYVACLAAYNNGQLHGCWLDATQSTEELRAAVQSMLVESPIPNAEEWAIHDYEGFCGYSIEEYADFETVSAIAAFILEHGEVGASVLNYTGGDLSQGEIMMTERYYGLYDSEADFVEDFSTAFSEIPDSLICYIDYEKIARDWFITDFLSLKINHHVAVFSCY